MSEAVKIHDSVRLMDGYALFDEDNVLQSPSLFIRRDEAFAEARKVNAIVWDVEIKRKEKAVENPLPKKRKTNNKPIELELVKGEL